MSNDPNPANPNDPWYARLLGYLATHITSITALMVALGGVIQGCQNHLVTEKHAEKINQNQQSIEKIEAKVGDK